MSARCRVVILDDHPLILDGLAGHLESVGADVVARCGTAESAREAFDTLTPEVAIVDIKVNGQFTFELMAEVLRTAPELRVIFITGFDDDAFIERAFQLGALGFVLKSDPPDELARAISIVRAGRRYVSPTLLSRFPDLERDDASPIVTTRLATLTPREREILKLVSSGKSAKEISQILKISTWTVTNHKANIMAKLDIHNQVGLTRFAVSTGLVSL